MTDVELIELAAKAGGVCLHPEDQLRRSYGNWGCDTRCKVCGKDPSDASWHPLTNDGDAFRLMVDLELIVAHNHHGVEVRWGGDHVWENKASDTYAATRRAIVLAAAEIGKVL